MKPQAAPSTPDSHADDPRAWLSALADGEADTAEQACTRWRDDPEARRTWHAYHLIGDVMRSEDLAAPAARDAAFLQGLRARLAAEPVVLAPEPAAPAAAARRRQPWLVPVAAAAGFVAVAGVLVVTRVSQPDGQAVQEVARVMPRTGAEVPALPAGARQVTTTVAMPGPGADAGAVLTRDPRLDEFLRAHRLVRGGLAVGAAPGVVTGGTLRAVDVTVPAAPAR